MTAMTEMSSGMSQVIDICKYSSLRKLLRITAWVMKFLENVRTRMERKATLKVKVGRRMTEEDVLLGLRPWMHHGSHVSCLIPSWAQGGGCVGKIPRVAHRSREIVFHRQFYCFDLSIVFGSS